jgi:lipoprotein-anchoring transpeptidase ErfK/SrfK
MKLGKLAAILMIGAAETLAETPTHQILVSIPDRKLVLLEDGKVKKVYSIAVGKESTPSPTGTFHIASRVKDPTWYGPHVVVPPGKANPLGTRWMGLGFKGYGIHGTNAPRSIGKAASHGCIRMRIQDVEELFSLVSVGDEVDLIGERNEQIAKVLPDVPAAPAVAEVSGGGQ